MENITLLTATVPLEHIAISYPTILGPKRRKHHRNWTRYMTVFTKETVPGLINNTQNKYNSAVGGFLFYHDREMLTLFKP
jgi:hypothetical protein